MRHNFLNLDPSPPPPHPPHPPPHPPHPPPSLHARRCVVV